ncbi:MAG: vWA domain-containing protein [Pirellulaceae bacterium]
MPTKIAVSNGQQFRYVSVDELPGVLAEGFYRPSEYGMTIVGNDEHQFEIPLTDVDTASKQGLADLLAGERAKQSAASTLDAIASSGSNDAAELPPTVVSQTAATAINATPGSSLPAATDERSLLMTGLSDAEMLAQQEQQEQEQELAEAEGISWYMVYMRQWLVSRQAFLERQLGSHGISIMIHVAIFLLLASLVMVDDTQEKSVLVSSPSNSRDVVEEIIIEPDSLEITEPTDAEDSPPESEEVETAETEVVMMDFMASVSGQAVKPPAVASKDDGMGKEIKEKTSAVFGTQATAVDYVFVIDNSNSMTKGRFETALNELMIAVNGLNKKQRFYVIFYSDTAYGMMYPNPVTQMVAATNTNKQQLYRWLTTVPLCLKTNGKEAIQAAFDMKPDVIYVLGDGAFTDNASRHFAKQPRTKTILHTRGMQVSGGLAKSFEELAKAHGGNYKDVGVAPAAVVMAQRNPRPRNNTRNGVWGLTLPVK